MCGAHRNSLPTFRATVLCVPAELKRRTLAWIKAGASTAVPLGLAGVDDAVEALMLARHIEQVARQTITVGAVPRSVTSSSSSQPSLPHAHDEV
jgi:hypothetical protein